jgi:N,N'-diacetyllegionaminate synthase
MKKPYIVAEIAQGYEGSEKLVAFYVKAASVAGADAIKFQIFYADELALPDYKYYQLFKGLELPVSVWDKSVKEAHVKGMEFYSDVFGSESLSMLEKIGVDGYKIHTTDINNTRLLKLVANTQKKVYLSTGGCEQEEIDKALEILDGCHITLMYGFQAEPTETEDNNLNRIQTLKKIYNRPVGFQDHSAGDSKLAVHLPFVALGAGADVIEKHLTLSRAAEIEDYISALTPEEFREWAFLIRAAYNGLGKSEWVLTEKEHQYRGKVRRAVCTVREIEKGKRISSDDVIMKRTDMEDVIYELPEVIGRKTVKNIQKNIPIRKGDIH